jgi:hypothetical protein
MGEWIYRAIILDLGTRWIYPWGKSPGYPLDRRLGRSQSHYVHCGVEKNLLPLQGIKPQPSSLQLVAIPTELSQVPN